jgi:hypothetical protein
MGQLDTQERPLSLHERRDPAKAFDLQIIPKAQVIRADAAIRFHSRGLGDNKTRPPDSPGTQVNQVPFIGDSILGGILAHGRNSNAVLKYHIT